MMATTNATHTPGPWRVVDEDIQAEDGTHVVCFGHDYDEYGGIEARWPAIGPDDQFTDEQRATHTGEVEANKRLIAAAPDLFAACKRVAQWIEEQSSPFTQAMCREVLAAVAKAEGR